MSVLSGCGSLPSYSVVPRDVPPPLSVGAEVDGKQITLARTQQLVVRLDANPSTGYAWRYEIANDLVLFPSGDTPVFVPGATDGSLGAGGTAVYTFRADGSGATGVKFLYGRAEDKPTQPAKLISFNVVTH